MPAFSANSTSEYFSVGAASLEPFLTRSACFPYTPTPTHFHILLTQIPVSHDTHNNSLFHPTPVSQGQERETGVVPAFCSGTGFNYLTFPSTGSQAPCRWQVLINVTFGSVTISSHDTPYSPSLSLCLSSHIFNFISSNVSITVASMLAALSFFWLLHSPCSSFPIPLSLDLCF